MDASSLFKAFILFVFFVVGCQQPETPDRPPRPMPPPKPSKAVGLFKSEPTFKALGWSSRWDWQGAEATLKRLSVDYEVVEPDQLDDWNGKLLILPNVRNMSPQTVKLITLKKSALLATYMSSYRQQDNSSWSPNNFALSEPLGIDFEAWVGSGDKADSLHLGQELGEAKVPLGRHLAMLVRPHPEAQVLAKWNSGAAAIVQGPRGIFVGEDLFCPENAESMQTLTLVAALLNRLHPECAVVPSEVGEPTLPEPPYVELPEMGKQVRVGLGKLEGEVRLRAPQQIEVEGQSVGTTYHWKGESVRLVGQPYLELLHERTNGTYRWGAYRGALEIDRDGTMVNVLDFEHYLAGVVPSEVPSYFPEEALKSMAVVARTFGLAHLGRHARFDVCPEVHCQVYRGLAKEAKSTNLAVQGTTGTTVSFAGGTADTTFHAVCGGLGADVWRVWPRASQVAYLESQPDQPTPQEGTLQKEEDLRAFIDSPPPSFCSQSGRFRWSRTYQRDELMKILAKGLKGTLGSRFAGLSSLETVKVVARTPSGRAQRLRVSGGGQEYEVEGDAIRWLFSGGRIGTGGLQSTLFYIAEKGDEFELRGGGWGHGVGLCQQGAAGRATAGQSYHEILAHYYPGTELKGGPSNRAGDDG